VQEQYIMLKQISLAALAATFITGSAAVAHAEGDAGLNEAAAAWTTSAALERGAHEGAFAAWPSYGYASYGYARDPMVVHSSGKHARNAKMNHKKS
jgi:succinate-acetate transporter protein